MEKILGPNLNFAAVDSSLGLRTRIIKWVDVGERGSSLNP